MKNQKEIYEALLAGKKLRHINWDSDRYLYLGDYYTMNKDGHLYTEAFSDYAEWSIYKELKQKTAYYFWMFEMKNGNIHHTTWAIDESGHCGDGGRYSGWDDAIKRTKISEAIYKSEE